jgi:hypothetical protein
MNDKFINPDYDYSLHELYEDGFLDSEYPDRELPDDFFFDSMTEALKDDPNVIIPRERMYLNNVALSTVGSIEQELGSSVMVFGTKYVQPTMYDIQPDYEPAVVVLKYYFDFMENPEVQFPFVPVAQPVIPYSAQEKTISFVDIELVMERAGGLIYDPTFAYQEKKDNSFYVHPTCEENEIKQFKKKMKKKKFLFSTKSTFDEWVIDEYDVACFEFNPMHPLAAPYILEYEDDMRIIKGKYKWGRHVKTFLFDRFDKRNRIHSEVWYSLFGSKIHYMSMFDILSNFDIIKYVPLFESCSDKRKYNIYVDQIVEGYTIEQAALLKEKNSRIYSYMKEERSNKEEECQQWVIPFYSNIPILIGVRGELFYDVTQHFDICFHENNKYELMIINKINGNLEMVIMKGEEHRNFRGSNSLFVYLSLRHKKFKCYSRTKFKDISYDSRRFIFCRGCYFIGVPRNNLGSLIYDPSILSFSQYMQNIKTMATDAELPLRSLPVFLETTKEVVVENLSTGVKYDLDDIVDLESDVASVIQQDEGEEFAYNFDDREYMEEE